MIPTLALNEWTAEGWTFGTMQFAMRDSSKRPCTAFITFTRPDAPEAGAWRQGGIGTSSVIGR